MGLLAFLKLISLIAHSTRTLYHLRRPQEFPQGSNLGPLLFLIFINDIVESIEVEHQIYADDLKLCLTVEDPGDCLKLQRSLNGVSEWSIANRLPLNAAKCSVMTITRKHSSCSYSYTMDQVPLASNSTVGNCNAKLKVIFKH